MALSIGSTATALPIATTIDRVSKFGKEIPCTYNNSQLASSAAASRGTLYRPRSPTHPQYYLFNLMGAHTVQTARIFDPKGNEITLGGLSGIGNCKTNSSYGQNIFACDLVPDLKSHQVLHPAIFSFNSGFGFFFPNPPQAVLLPQADSRWKIEKWDIESVASATTAQGISYYFLGTEPIRLETSASTDAKKIKEKKPPQMIWYSTKDQTARYLTLPESMKMAKTNLGIEGLDTAFDPNTQETTLYVGFENRPGEEFGNGTPIYRYLFKENPAEGRWLEQPLEFQFNELLPRENPKIPTEAVCYENLDTVNGLPMSALGYSAYETMGLSDLQFIEKTTNGDVRFLVVSRGGVGFYKAKKESGRPEEISGQFYVQVDDVWFDQNGKLVQKTPVKISSDLFSTEKWQPYNIEGIRLFKNEKGEMFAVLFTDNNLKDFDPIKMKTTPKDILGSSTLFLGAQVTEQTK